MFTLVKCIYTMVNIYQITYTVLLGIKYNYILTRHVNSAQCTQCSVSMVKYTINNAVQIINHNKPPHCGRQTVRIDMLSKK